MATDDRKTRPTTVDPADVIAAVTDPKRRSDAERLLAVMRRITGVEPVLWGDSLVGFGRQPYTGADHKQREWFAVGFAARKAALSLYGLTYYGSNADLLERLGPHTLGKGCLYLKRLDDANSDVLEELIRRAWETNHTPQ